ncbi:hypothetical protein VP758_000879 [Vibrio harveyi]|nr:hypothetical protein [Vibrio harveyi]
MRDSDGDKFCQHYPLDNDLTLKILKGHLLAEEALRELFHLQLRKPEALKGNQGTSLECHQVICLLEAMLPKNEKIDWVWVATKKLNSLRNKLAHNLEPSGMQHKVDDLTKYVMSKSMNGHIPNMTKDTNERDPLTLAIMAICATLSALKDISSNRKIIKD